MLINGKEERRILIAGERITIPPGVMHWHGPKGDNFTVHQAVNYTRMGESGTYWSGEDLKPLQQIRKIFTGVVARLQKIVLHLKQ